MIRYLRIDLEKSNVKLALIFIALCLFFYHLLTLVYSPLPWFDETFFASIANSVAEGKGFMLDICPLQTNGEPVYIYGPLYFLLTAINIKIFGLGIFSFRIVNFIFGVGVVFLVASILKRLVTSPKVKCLIMCLLVFDTIFLQNCHSGRMDLMALFFMLLAYRVLVDNTISNVKLFFTGLWVVLSVLTTVRVAFLLLPLVVILTYKMIYNRKILSYLFFIIPICIIYLLWFLFAFGNIHTLVSYYLGGTNSVSYLGGNLFIPKYQIPLLILCMYLVFIWLRFEREKTIFQVSLLFSILCFYVFIKDTGVYSAYVIPLIYIFIAISLKRVNTLVRYTLFILLFLNMTIFLVKQITVLSSLSQRDPYPIEQWTRKLIPENSRVVGDDLYYYAVLKTHSSFQYIQRGTDLSSQIRYHAKEYRADFIFVSNSISPEIIVSYLNSFEVKEKYNFISEDVSTNLMKRILERFGFVFSSDYDGTLYRVSPK